MTWPNVLVLSYMIAANQITPEIELKARDFVNQGYQLLLTYEVDGGGYSWFGDAPANINLTAIGLLEFTDMSRVHEIDPAMISRTQQYLASVQKPDGHWESNHMLEYAQFEYDSVRSTALNVWGLAYSGYTGEAVARGLNFMAAKIGGVDDAYSLALMANAFVAADPAGSATQQVLQKLDDMKVETDDEVFWPADSSTVTYSSGDGAAIEATAIAAQAMLNAHAFPDSSMKAMTFLIRHKTPDGGWGSTQATIQSLRAFMASLNPQVDESADATVRISLNGFEAAPVRITPENSDVLHMIDMEQYTLEGPNVVEIDFEGSGNLLYQIVGRHYVPFDGMQPSEALTITVGYDKTTMSVDDIVTANVEVRNNVAGDVAQMVIVDLGIPPGFDVQTEDLAALVEQGKINRYETTSRQLVLYVLTLEYGHPLEFSYRLKAKFPVKSQTPQSSAYMYYTPEEKGTADPVTLEVQ